MFWAYNWINAVINRESADILSDGFGLKQLEIEKIKDKITSHNKKFSCLRNEEIPYKFKTEK